jgi:hypothetical protein
MITVLAEAVRAQLALMMAIPVLIRVAQMDLLVTLRMMLILVATAMPAQSVISVLEEAANQVQ